MRSLIFVTCLLLAAFAANPTAAAAGAADFNHVEAVGRQFKRLHEQVAADFANAAAQGQVAAARRMDTAQLQQNTSSACAAVSSARIGAIYNACYDQSKPDVTNPLFELYLTDAEAKAGITAFRSTTCLAEFLKVLEPATMKCMPFEYVRSAAFMEYFFEEAGTDKEPCALMYTRFNRMFGGCSNFGPATCAKTSDLCRLVPTGYVGDLDYSTGTVNAVTTAVCEPDFSASSLANICTGCFSGFLDEYKDLDVQDRQMRNFELLDGLFCGSKSPSGDFCYARIQKFADKHNGSPFSTEAGAAELCGSSDLLPCYQRTYLISVSNVRADARSDFTACINAHRGNATLQALCKDGLRYILSFSKRVELQMKYLCSKNAAGGYVAVAQDKLYRSTNGCYAKARAGLACSDCQATLQASVNSMGCGAGILQEIYTAPLSLQTSDFPTIWGYTAVADTVTQIGTTAPLTIGTGEVATTAAGTGYLATMTKCGVTGLNNTLRVKCAPSSKKIAKSLRVLIRWAGLNATQKEALKRTLKLDVSTNVGLAGDSIVNDVLSEDTTTNVSAARRAASNNNAVKYDFEIQAQDEASTNAASATFDDLDASSGFSLTETEAELGTTVDTTPSEVDSSSGARHGFGLASALVAFGLLVFAM